jgi:hypothetical protein
MGGYVIEFKRTQQKAITSVELKEMLAQEWAGCLFDVVHNVDGPTG